MTKKTKSNEKKINRHVLVSVLSSDNRGLVGFTEDGEEISLSAPVPRILRIRKSFPGEPLKNIFMDNDEGYWRDILEDARPALKYLKPLKDVYFQFEDSYSIDECINREIEVPYNIYTKRTSALIKRI